MIGGGSFYKASCSFAGVTRSGQVHVGAEQHRSSHLALLAYLRLRCVRPKQHQGNAVEPCRIHKAPTVASRTSALWHIRKDRHRETCRERPRNSSPLATVAAVNIASTSAIR